MIIVSFSESFLSTLGCFALLAVDLSGYLIIPLYQERVIVFVVVVVVCRLRHSYAANSWLRSSQREKLNSRRRVQRQTRDDEARRGNVYIEEDPFMLFSLEYLQRKETLGSYKFVVSISLKIRHGIWEHENLLHFIALP